MQVPSKTWCRFAGLLALCIALPASAAAAPKVAVLGLEIIDDGSTNQQLVQKTADVAKLFTDRLRTEAEKSGTYRLAPNSRKDLLELKLLSNCSDENASCMSEIGRELKTDVIIYGKLERRSAGYWVHLTLFSVDKSKIVKTAEGVVPFREALPGAIDGHTQRMLATLTGTSSASTLVVHTESSASGTVSLNGQVRGKLEGGTFRIPDLAPGAYTLRVEAPGFQPRAQQIQMRAGEELALEITLVATDRVSGGGDADTAASGGASKVVFWSAAVATAGATGVWIFSAMKIRGAEDDLKKAARALGDDADYMRIRADMNVSTADDCKISDILIDEGRGGDAEVAALQSACDKGNKFQKLSWIAGISTGVFALTAGYFGYRAFIQDDAAAPKADESAVRVEPYLGPDIVGAGMTIKF